MEKRENIQLWRVASCLMVFMVHFGQRINLQGPIRTLTDFGAFGVQFFFIISGFLIANSFFLYGYKNYKLYIVKRLIKILPLYFIIILYYYVVHNFILCDVPKFPEIGWSRYFLVLNGILPETGTYFWDNLGITWTIPYFFYSYIILPFVLRRVDRLYSALILWIISCVLADKISLFNGWFNMLSGIPFFVEGIILYFCFKEKKQTCTSVAVLALILYHIISKKIDVYLYSYIFMLLIITTEHFSYNNAIIKKIFGVIDQYSYTMYLVHGVIFIHILDRFELGRCIETLIAIVGTAVLTVIVHRGLEKPFQQAFYKLLNNETRVKST